MKIIETIKSRLDSSVVTIGSFDGIHLGHKQIFNQLKAKSIEYNVPSVVIIFDPHPREFFNKQILRITDLDSQKEKIKAQHMDYLVVLKFDESLSKVSAYDFIYDWIYKPFNPKCILVGHDFAFGHKRQGNIGLLEDMSKKYTFELTKVDAVKLDNHIISSTLIRKSILNDISFANKLLGEYYYIKGIVIKGEGRGKKLGFPTMNLKITSDLIPKNGVYVTRTHIDQKIYNSVTNIGYRPTFSSTRRHVETHLLNYNKDTYNTEVKLEFHKYLRDEKKFNSAKELALQIKKDVKKAKTILV